MQFESYNIKGLLSFCPRRFKDERGLFFESFNQKAFEEALGQSVNFVQDNESHSKLNVIRGLHFQIPPYAQGKLVRVSQGRALDIVVDIRTGSDTYGQSLSLELSAENGIVFWIPEGFAHGFVALADTTVFNYKCTNYYHRESERSLLWNDKDLNIDWIIDGSAILSDKDRNAQAISAFKSPF